jgi:hypothetical protein
LLDGVHIPGGDAHGRLTIFMWRDGRRVTLIGMPQDRAAILSQHDLFGKTGVHLPDHALKRETRPAAA